MLNDFIKRLKQSGSITRKSGSGRPRMECKRRPTSTLLMKVLSQD